jgi:hypothetical protein
MYSIERNRPVVTHYESLQAALRVKRISRFVHWCAVEDLEQIRVELLALIERQVEALERDTFVGLTDVERYEYDARQDRIHELHAKLGQLKTAA